MGSAFLRSPNRGTQITSRPTRTLPIRARSCTEFLYTVALQLTRGTQEPFEGRASRQSGSPAEARDAAGRVADRRAHRHRGAGHARSSTELRTFAGDADRRDAGLARSVLVLRVLRSTMRPGGHFGSCAGRLRRAFAPDSSSRLRSNARTRRLPQPGRSTR